MTIPRPGGRTARTKAVVFEAASALLAERGPAALTMTDIAERAGVAATSLYRRWGDVGALLLEVVVEQLTRERPLPDTGSLRGDLRVWARSIALSLKSAQGSAFFKVMVANAARTGAREPSHVGALEPRFKQIEVMLHRARQRGEQAPSALDVLDFLLAPLYVRALFGMPGTKAFAEHLVDRL